MDVITPEEREAIKAEVRAIYQEVADEFRDEFKKDMTKAQEDMSKVQENMETASEHLEELLGILNELKNSEPSEVLDPDDLKNNIQSCVRGECNGLRSLIQELQQKIDTQFNNIPEIYHCQNCGNPVFHGTQKCPACGVRLVWG